MILINNNNIIRLGFRDSIALLGLVWVRIEFLKTFVRSCLIIIASNHGDMNIRRRKSSMATEVF